MAVHNVVRSPNGVSNSGGDGAMKVRSREPDERIR